MGIDGVWESGGEGHGGKAPASFRWLTSLAAAVILGVLLYADRRDQGPSPPSALPDDPAHVHSLALNPADESVLVGAHDGLYRFRESGKSLQRVGRGYQDTKALAVVGPDRLLSSGHSDSQALQAGLPPHLGLVESRDGGRTWQSLSLAGKADFHVLRAVGENVYGYDAAARTLLASMDGGKTWAERVPPGTSSISW